MNIKKKYQQLPVTVRASMWFFVCSFLQRGISTLTTPIFTRLLSKSEYGDYSAFMSWLEIITVFATLKLGFGVFMQGCVKFEENRAKFASSLLALATTWWFGALVIYGVFHNFWNHLFGLSTFEMLCMFVMMLATIAFNFWSVIKRVDFDYVPLVKLTLLISVLKPVFGVAGILLFPQHRLQARIASLALVELLCYAGLYFSIRKGSKVWYDKQYWKYALGYNLPLIPHFLSQTILNHSDRIMIKQMCGNADAGVYSLAYNISMIMTMVNTSIQNTLNPWIYKKIKEKQFKEIASVSYVVLGIVALANFMLICIAPELVRVFAPPEYFEAIYVIPPVAMGCYFLFMYCLYADFELYEAKTTYMMIASVIGAGLNLLLNYIFIQQFGYIAAAYTTLICYMVYSGVHYIFMRHVCKKNLDNVHVYDMRIILGISAVFIISGILMMNLYTQIWARYLILAALVGVVYLKRKQLLAILGPVLKNKKKKGKEA